MRKKQKTREKNKREMVLPPTANVNAGAKPVARRRTRWVLALVAYAILASCVAGVGLYYGFCWYATPKPPTVDLANAEPAVALVIQKAFGAVREAPNSADAWGHLGMILRAHGYTEADECLAQAERLDPKEPRWPYLQGIHIRTSDADAALPYIERAAERCETHSPRYTTPRLVLAEMLLDKGRNAEAVAHLNQVLEHDPRSERAYYDLGAAAFARDNLKECIRYLTPLAASPFAHQKAANMLATVYLRRDDPKTSADFTRRARDLPPDLAWPDPFVTEYMALDVSRQGRLQRVEALGQDKKTLKERVEILTQLVDEFPDGQSCAALGMIHLEAGSYSDAEQMLRLAVQKSPNHAQAHYFLSVALYYQAEQLRDRGLAQTKYREAAEFAGRAAELKPDLGSAHLMHGMALRQIGEGAAALAALRRAAECRPEVAEIHETLGETLADNGLDLAALAELHVAVELGQKEPAVQMKARARYAQVLLRAFLPAFP